MSSKIETKYMIRAIELGKNAMNEGEIPVGAVVVCDGEIIGEGANRCEIDNNATLHAEILAIEKASKHKNNWRLNDCTMYVSLEPCPMCMGAIISSRLNKVIFGAYNEKTGACASCMSVEDFPMGNKPMIVGGYMQNECKQVMIDFFERKRLEKNK